MIGLPLSEIQDDPDLGPDILSEAAFELSSMDTFTSGRARSEALDEFEARGGPKLSPKELNEKYKDVEVPFNQPIDELSAFHLNEEGIKRRKLKEAMNSSPGSDFYKGTVNFAQGLLAHAMDPVEFGVGAISGWAFAGAGALLSKAANPLLAGAGNVLGKQGFAYSAAEGIAGNAAIEPMMYSDTQRAQVDYSLTDSALSVFGGGLAFPTLKFAGGKSIDFLGGLPKSTKAVAMKNALGQIYSGKKPDVSLTKEVFDDLAYGPMKPDAKVGPVRADYEYAPRSLEELKTQQMFIASKQAGSLDGGSRQIGDNYFGDDGLYITDNPRAANNISNHPLDTDGPAGDVFSTRIEDVNLLDLDITGREILDDLEIPEDLRMLLNDADDLVSAHTILRELAEESGDDLPLKEFTEALRSKGYDGFKYSDDSQGHNSAYIFPESKEKIVADSMYPSDNKAIKAIDQDKLNSFREKVMSEENDLFHDPIIKQEFDSFKPEKINDTFEAISKDLDEKLKVLDELERSGAITDKEELKMIQKFKESKSLADEQLKVIEEFTECILSGAD